MPWKDKNKKRLQEKKWKIKNPEKVKLYKKRSREKKQLQKKQYIALFYILNRNEIIKRYVERKKIESLRAMAWQKKNPDKRLDISRKQRKREVIELRDVYIKRLIVRQFGIKYSDISNELIVFKRKQLELKRQLKKAKEV
jgi:hypothetical protein